MVNSNPPVNDQLTGFSALVVLSAQPAKPTSHHPDQRGVGTFRQPISGLVLRATSKGLLWLSALSHHSQRACPGSCVCSLLRRLGLKVAAAVLVIPQNQAGTIPAAAAHPQPVGLQSVPSGHRLIQTTDQAAAGTVWPKPPCAPCAISPARGQ